jgi:predicted phage gp36 major capsid-like protein
MTKVVSINGDRTAKIVSITIGNANRLRERTRQEQTGSRDWARCGGRPRNVVEFPALTSGPPFAA